MKTLVILCVVLVAASAVRVQRKESMLCSFCMSFVGGIETFLKNEEGPIETYANKLCDTLTKGNVFLDPICKGLLDTELVNIIEWLNNNEKPADICPKIHLC